MFNLFFVSTAHIEHKLCLSAHLERIECRERRAMGKRKLIWLLTFALSLPIIMIMADRSGQRPGSGQKQPPFALPVSVFPRGESPSDSLGITPRSEGSKLSTALSGWLETADYPCPHEDKRPKVQYFGGGQCSVDTEGNCVWYTSVGNDFSWCQWYWSGRQLSWLLGQTPLLCSSVLVAWDQKKTNLCPFSPNSWFFLLDIIFYPNKILMFQFMC